jgi:hypothetical protein
MAREPRQNSNNFTSDMALRAQLRSLDTWPTSLFRESFITFGYVRAGFERESVLPSSESARTTLA